jgi:septin 3/9/12
VISGKAVRGRRTRAGIINGTLVFLTLVEDPSHCEFSQMRHFLTRTHLQDLIETTAIVHYESFRTKQLIALKENSKSGNH